VTIDHAFFDMISIACGIIWYKFGFQYVFLVGMLIAIVYFFSSWPFASEEDKACGDGFASGS